MKTLSPIYGAPLRFDSFKVLDPMVTFCNIVIFSPNTAPSLMCMPWSPCGSMGMVLNPDNKPIEAQL